MNMYIIVKKNGINETVFKILLFIKNAETGSRTIEDTDNIVTNITISEL